MKETQNLKQKSNPTKLYYTKAITILLYGLEIRQLKRATT